MLFRDVTSPVGDVSVLVIGGFIQISVSLLEVAVLINTQKPRLLKTSTRFGKKSIPIPEREHSVLYKKKCTSGSLTGS